MNACARGIAAAALLLAVGAAGIQAAESVAPGSISDPQARVAAADASPAETVTVTMYEYSFDPSRLVFERGRLYRLHLENKGLFAHTFASEEFFKAIEVQKPTSMAGKTSSAEPTSVEVRAGESKDLDFVPIQPGVYDLVCPKFLHSAFGMTGTITIR